LPAICIHLWNHILPQQSILVARNFYSAYLIEFIL
jgi:hypothetical protein